MNKLQNVHLICNAHLDPVWLWQWEEGAAEAISTFRTAADLCEKYDTFVFNHNEVVLYEWVEEYDPELFERIRKLVKAGKWHIMGGWYLQPDCNMTSGEGIARQVLLGQKYFREKFGAAPRVAANLDPFGHSRGMVQILTQSGYTGYLFCRPTPANFPLPDKHFRWIGLDGSELLGACGDEHYLSLRGTARKKVEKVIGKNTHRPVDLVLWGIGNHGGGPSKIDLENLGGLIAETTDCRIAHSTPESFFDELAEHRDSLGRHEGSVGPWGAGCFSTSSHIKRAYRAFENELFSTEKILSAAVLHGLLEYPRADMAEAQRDLVFSQFHDILPGGLVKSAHDDALRRMSHGKEILSRMKARAFFAMTKDQKSPADGEIPIMVFNSHPYKVRTKIECEFQMADQNWSDTFTDYRVYSGKKQLPSQIEQEEANVPLDWRKRIVFEADLAPSSVSRFDCKPNVLPRKPKPRCKTRSGMIMFKNPDMEVRINTRTGLVDRYSVGKVNVLRPGAFRPLAMVDSSNAWSSMARRFRKIAGRFKAMNSKDAAEFAGLRDRKLPAVRVIEDGEARTVVEALFSFGHSRISQRYYLPKSGSGFSVRTLVFWNESDTMLKLQVPLAIKADQYVGQTMFGSQSLDTTGDEMVSQKWLAVADRQKDVALTVINDGSYASDCKNDELRLTLLRSPAFSGLPVEDRSIVPLDRFTMRTSQGENVFNFTVDAGKVRQRLDKVDREAAVQNEKPYALSFFPNGCGKAYGPAITLSDKVVQVSAVKPSEYDDSLIVRLYEPTGRKRTTTLALPTRGIEHKVTLKPFELATLRIDLASRKVSASNPIEIG